jgi:hypothetical protein
MANIEHLREGYRVLVGTSEGYRVLVGTSEGYRVLVGTSEGYRVLIGTSEGTVGNLRVKGRIIRKWSLEEVGRGCGLDRAGSG